MLLLAALCASTVAISLAGQLPFHFDPNEAMLSLDIDDFIETTLREWGSPGGLGVAVVKMQDDGAWKSETKGYGLAKSDGTKVTPDTWFSIASNSKLFDILATGLLISNKTLSPRISWDTPIASILPPSLWNLSDPVTSSASTILDLMSHRTGLPRDDHMYTNTDTLDSLLPRLSDLKVSAPFRSTFQYNNNMYTVLSHLPTYLLPHHPTFTAYVKENIFDRLGLNETTYDGNSVLASGRLAQGFSRDAMNSTFDMGIARVIPAWFRGVNEGADGASLMSGAGGVVMSVNNAAVWLQTLLLEGRNPITNESIIPADIIRKVATGVTVMAGASTHPSLSPIVYGGGQMISSYQGRVLVEHGGSVPGHMTQISRLPNDGLGVAVFSNDETHGARVMEIVKFHIIDKVLGLPHVDWDGTLKARAAAMYNQTQAKKNAPQPENPSMPWSTAKLEGTYTNGAYGDILLCSATSSNSACPPFPLPTPEFPTLISKWDRILSTHLHLQHFDGNLWNASVVAIEPIAPDASEVWMHAVDDFLLATVAEDGSGFGLSGGFWGAGAGVPEPSGETLRERSETWFKRVR